MKVSNPGRMLALGVTAAVLGATAFALLVLMFVWLGGGLSSGPNIDWQAVGALAGVAAAFASAGTLATLAVAFSQLREAQRDIRVSRKPYLRCDIAFREPAAREENLHLVDTEPLTLRALGQTQVVFPPESGLAPEAVSSESLSLVLQVTNLQQQPLGIADNVAVSLHLLWSATDPTRYLEVIVELAYVAPGQTTTIEVARVRPSAEYLFAQIASVRYEDIFSSPNADTHGALKMRYHRGDVFNQREVIRYDAQGDSAGKRSADTGAPEVRKDAG